MMSKVFRKAAAVIVSFAMIFVMQLNVPFSLKASAAVEAIWPMDPEYKTITTYFSEYRNTVNPESSEYHNAIDISGQTGLNIYAVRAGRVVTSGWLGGYGYIIILFHEDLGGYTFYAHCSELDVYEGDTVAQGQIIGKVGNTGNSYGSHLHFGICSSLLNNWPARTYYDPLSFFSYTDSPSSDPGTSNSSDCGCSTDYAGIYTTKNVVTFLYIRSGHGSNYSALGQIPAGSTVKVTMGDGSWAHVEFNGITGYSSMDYLEKTGDIESNMSISGANIPSGSLTPGTAFSVQGEIKSDVPIAKVWGGVYNTNGERTAEFAEAAPRTYSYNINTYFDKQIRFENLTTGTYQYKIEAVDTNGTNFVLISEVFSIGSDPIKGDLNDDGSVTVADAVLLQSFLIHRTELTAAQYGTADINSDNSVDVFDMVSMKKLIFGSR